MPRPPFRCALSLVFATLTMHHAPAQDDPFEAGEVTQAGHRFPYRLLSPPQIEPGTLYPLIVFLHGAGERGDDNEHQLHWLPHTIAEPANRAAFPCFVLALQCPNEQKWVEVPWDATESTPMAAEPSPAIAAVITAMQRVLSEQPVDDTRVYLTGLSMGGYGTFDLACRHPEWFAAVAPICGGGDERQVQRLVGLPIWIWHGGADPVVPTVRSRTMVEALRAADGDVKYTELPGVGHDSWKQAYGEGGLLPWLFEQRRAPAAIAPFVPWPHDLVGTNDAAPLRLGKQLRISVPDDATRAHAAHFADELQRLTGSKATIAKDGDADITLALDATLPAGGFALDLAAHAKVTGKDVQGLAAGTAALLQALHLHDGQWSAPPMRVHDAPQYAFRAVLIDCARHFQSIATLRRVIELCRLYRVPEIVLHLSDHEGFRFPSTKIPEAVSAQHYTLDDLHALVAFADAAGVTLVPELDVPGHCSTLVHARPEVFGLADHEHHGSIVNPGRASTADAVAQLIGEMSEVFASSPWFHIGGDEVDLSGVAEDPDCKAAMKALGTDDPQELYRDFVCRMHAAVKRLGKQTLVWEGFARGGKTAMPKDLIVIAWESAYYRPDQLIADGFRVINASWQPLYVVGGGRLPPHAAPRRWSAAHIYRWQPRRWEHFAPGYPSYGGLEVDAKAPVLGAMMCVWEQEDGTAVPHLRERLPAFAERTWNPTSTRGFADLAARARATDALVGALLPAGDDGDADEWATLQHSGSPRVRYHLFVAPAGGFETVPDLTTLTPYATGTLPLLRGGPLAGPMGVMLEATLQVPSAGDYTFRFESCDGPAKLYLDGKLVCDHAQKNDWQGIEATVTLTAGDVALRIDSAQGVFSTLCRVQWRAAGSTDFTLVDAALRGLE